ncbi:penicillin-binding transpeptidase domain-containing protein [Butyricicoccus faecihominis]|uniref:penicillin-binding transpeptidase domain-containing protein n=1 Tax=Butyricicoccaceae TaxID=3085642 RepID=UPI00247A6777|nr:MULTISPECIES: penicillin-binding transpeptidase domain-containing protein [Butyricicoccaceae]MCQ5129814.1 penicillin-binding transpeptidase domain-containing protein [Butyricicoccus faecihominis]WNX83742.1 penicillin-binding transpeptidase domain-containing protein [Agathobaculum sp. NTUH-O15-33]
MAMKGPNNQMRSRVVVLTLLFVVVGFGLVGARLLYMQVFHHDFYVQKATMLQTRDSIITPNRGTIYDCNKQVLAESATTEKVTISPKNVIDEDKIDAGISAEQQQETLAKILSEELSLNYETVLKKVQRTDTAYQEIAEKIDKETSNKLYKALEDADCKGVYPEPDTKRYYQYGAYLSAVLGYVSGDNNGVIGVEAKYEEELAGTAGRVVRAQNAKNQDMPYDYEQYIPATDGNSLVLTIDNDIQSYLEKHLETAMADNPDARDGVSGVVMNVKTGEILAMASLPDFDPNQPRVITNQRYQDEMKTKVAAVLTEYGVSADIPDAYYEKGGMENLPESVKANEKLVEAIGNVRIDELNKMWRNPVIMDTYEPGSTFKLMNVSTAYEIGTAHANDTYNCGGSLMVGDWSKPINCWKAGGHGSENLTEALMNSCNVAMMQIAFKTGMDRFYEFYKAFGMTEITGIDLPGEQKGIFHDITNTSAWNEVSLAVASFGQRFTVTPIQMINMVAAIVDDGKLKKPYVVKEVLGPDGSVKSTTETTVVRQVISAETSAFMRQAMQQVVENGTGKNAYVAGYRVGGKTATSELLKEKDDTEDRYTASFIGVAPMDDPQIAVLVAINDLPESATHGGGAIAAPVVGRVMEDVLPYIGVTPMYADEEADRREVSVPSLIGMDENQAAAALKEVGLSYRVVSNEGGTITDQVPAGGIKIPASGSVILYMGGSKPTEQIIVPDLINLSPQECRDTLSELGLYMKRKGVATSQTTGETVAGKQNPVSGTKVNIGSVITVDFTNSTDVGD